MSHDTHVIDGKHLELDQHGGDPVKLLELIGDWKDPFPEPVIETHQGIAVVRDDLIVDGGTKCRFADYLIKTAPQDTIVYVQPRVGLAGLSILKVAKTYGKKVVLFMPACREISYHQACCIERGAEPKFVRIAAMPNLNKIAQAWAAENNAFFVPLGLKHPLAIAAAIRVSNKINRSYTHPDAVFCATSTGVLVRGIQLGWERAKKFYAVCVARNMKAGELGKAIPITEPLAFQQAEKQENLPPFPTVNTYDGKAWKYALKYKQEHPEATVWFWNVGREPVLSNFGIFTDVHSDIGWKR